MESFLNLSEMNTLMDIAFLFQSVRNLKVMSQKFLQMLGRIVPYEKAAVFLYQEEKRQFSACAEVRCGSGMIRDYVDTYSNLDYLGWQIFQREETAFRESDGIRPEERESSRFYREFLRKYDAEYRLLLTGRTSSGQLLGVVMLFRSSIFEDFSPREVSVMEMLHNHFSAGIENTIRQEQISVQAHMAERVYKTIPDVILILDDHLSVQKGNASAEAFFQRLEDEPDKQREFFRILRTCCREMQEDHENVEDPASLPDFRQISLFHGTAKVSMVAHPDLQGRTVPRFLVVFSEHDPAGPGRSGQEEAARIRERLFQTMRRQYSLTKRELHLIELALEGMENQKIADTLHISLFTVKSHFQNAYAKLGLKNRQELFLVYIQYLISEEFRQEFDAQTRKDDYLW